VDNAIKLKKLQILTGALGDGMSGYNFYFIFSKGFFLSEEGSMVQFHPFPKEVFFYGIRRDEIFLGLGLTQRFVSWVVWVGKFWLFLKVGR
jgi:hypothetical protein